MIQGQPRVLPAHEVYHVVIENPLALDGLDFSIRQDRKCVVAPARDGYVGSQKLLEDLCHF